MFDCKELLGFYEFLYLLQAHSEQTRRFFNGTQRVTPIKLLRLPAAVYERVDRVVRDEDVIEHRIVKWE